MAKHDFPRFSDEYGKRWRKAGLWLDITLHQGFDNTVAAQPDKVALITAERRFTLAEYKAESDALAAGLLGIGIGPNDIVAVQLPNWVEFCFLQIALSRIGAVIQPIHMVFREREVANLVSFCDSDAIVVPETYKDFNHAEMVRALRHKLPTLRNVLITRGDARKSAGESSLNELIEEGRRNLDRLARVSPTAEDIFYLNFTSGTEGDPKGFLHIHNSVISMTQRLIQLMPKDTVMLACSPMTHTFGHFEMYYTDLAGFPM
ncbi:MAG: AMP-binding protein, partial [Proteobacteria bacterium]|nr:AMP-binding protein [Pseudomonadota bacterium]